MISRMQQLILVLLVAALPVHSAAAAAPEPWQLGFQDAATSVMERLTGLHDFLLWVITLITLLVLGLLLYICFKFRADKNPVPSRRSHHTLLEIVWTAVPVLILVVVAVPSFKLLYYMDVVPDSDLTIKATGHQWYWSYEYPDNGEFGFDAFMVADEDLEDGQLRLLTTDNRIVVPVQTNVRLQVTATDVIHSWAMPAFGIKIDAIPGLLNEAWFNVDEPGMYYGQCSELCGVNHGFMPIMVEAVSQEDFDAWVSKAQQEFAQADDIHVAHAQAAN